MSKIYTNRCVSLSLYVLSLTNLMRVDLCDTSKGENTYCLVTFNFIREFCKKKLGLHVGTM